MKKLKVIIAGGGTGGHIFPATAIANAIVKENSTVEILFVGAKGKMEMEKVPLAGYKIIGLPVAGFQRKLSIQNLLFPLKLIVSLFKALKVLTSFKPDVCIGVGGYASGPILQVANWLRIKTVIQEQNSYPGVTNKILAKKAQKIFTAFENLDSFFPPQKTILAGNPIRENIKEIKISSSEAKAKLNLNPNKKVVFVTGGSLGSSVINKSISKSIEKFKDQGVQLIWQTGKAYLNDYKMHESAEHGIFVTDFIPSMEIAYASADVIVSRAGGTISELACVGKPCVLLPSPNVAEDHQTKNVMALVKENAAIMIKDVEAEATLGDTVLELLNNQELCIQLSKNIKLFARPEAAKHIALEILKMIQA